MRDKTEAARVLLEKGWTFDEVAAVLGGEGMARPAPAGPPVRIVPTPQPYPYITPTVPDRWWNPWGNGSTLTINSVPTLAS